MNKTINAIMLIGIISSFTVTSLYADPVYLDCKVTSKDGHVRSFSLKLDEASNKITHSEIGRVFLREGIFSAKNIFYESVLLSSPIKDKYSIDRTSLDIVVHFDTIRIRPETTLYEGSCKIVEIKDRKI
jgi:hypothetical protein